ncbi:MAG: helix-turn-helix domain-containing protein [Bacillota bacterium]
MLWYKKGFSISEIAKKVNCSSGSVYYWINKKK